MNIEPDLAADLGLMVLLVFAIAVTFYVLGTYAVIL